LDELVRKSGVVDVEGGQDKEGGYEEMCGDMFTVTAVNILSVAPDIPIILD